MKKGMSGIINLIIFLAVALLGMVIYLTIFSNGVFDTWDGLSWVTGMNDPVELMKQGDAAYDSGDFDQAIESYRRLLSKNPVYEKRDETRLMLALSYAASKRYSKSHDELEKLYNDPLCESKSVIDSLRDYSSDPDISVHEWICCDLEEYGHIWVYGICGSQCKTPSSCDESGCEKKKPN